MLTHTFLQIYSSATVLILIERRPQSLINRTETWIQSHLPGASANILRLLVSVVEPEQDRTPYSPNQIVVSRTIADSQRLRSTIVEACSHLPQLTVNFSQLTLLAYIRNHL